MRNPCPFRHDESPKPGLNQTGSNQRSQNQTGPKPKIFDVNEYFGPLQTELFYENPINSLSLRVFSVVTFRWKNGAFVVNTKTRDLTTATIQYKLNNSKKPVSFYFDYTEVEAKKVETIVQKMPKDKYVHTNMNNKPFALMYKGHIHSCYESFEKMFWSCFEAGNLKLLKKDFNETEEYQLVSVVSGKSEGSGKRDVAEFKGIFLWHNTRIELLSLRSDKNPITEETCCVICYEGEAKVACLPCGHMCLCESPYCQVITSCPLCRTPTTQFLKIFV